jgi:CheY-like chemotaxis protein
MKKVLLVDDDAISNFLSKSMIEKSGVFDSVDVFNSAAKAIDFLKQLPMEKGHFPEVILLDVMMPVMDGFAFLDELVRFDHPEAKTVKVCMLTSSLDPKDKQQADAYPQVVDFMSKPINQEKIKKFVELINS